MAERAKWARGVGRFLGIAGVAIAVLAVRVVVVSHQELERGEALRVEGDTDAAVVHYRRAARWYAPGNPYVVRALDALAQIGAAAERDGDLERALFAWRSVRASILATRSVYQPHEERLALAEERIAELMASADPPPVDAGKGRAELKAEHLAMLKEHPRPHVGWTLLLLVGFVAWVGGAFAFASRAVDAEDRLIRREALRWAAVVVVGLVLWVAGMALA
ncbi:MAG: hypothetical protein ACODAU_08775 [Myxococcota bacterium]